MTSAQSGINLPFSDPLFLPALAGIQRGAVQIKKIAKDCLTVARAGPAAAENKMDGHDERSTYDPTAFFLSLMFACARRNPANCGTNKKLKTV